MKESRIIPIIALLLLIGIMAFSLVFDHSTQAPPAAPAASAPDASATIVKPATAAPVAVTNSATAPTEPPIISNTPPAVTTVKAAATPEKIQEAPAPTKPETKIVEMPATVPQAPTNFYSGEMAAQHAVATTNQNYFFRFRAGYQHTSFGGNNNDTYWLSLKFYAYGDQWRQEVGKNAWLVPDSTAEISHQDLPKNRGGNSSATTDALQVEANFFWPWFNWDINNRSSKNNYCPFSGPLALALGPTANAGFNQVFNSNYAPTGFGHAGARLTLNRDAFIEYTVGGDASLGGTRQQLATELPIYQSRDGQVRYVVRGLWDHVGGSHPDLLQGAFFVEMPFGFLVTPSKWSDLIPFTK
jgi:hypothetical protein